MIVTLLMIPQSILSYVIQPDDTKVQSFFTKTFQKFDCKKVHESRDSDCIVDKNIPDLKSTLLRVATPEDTAPCMLSQDSHLKEQPSDRIMFRLVYLPVHLSEKEVVKKLSKFGTVVSFSFLPTQTDNRYISTARGISYRSAEFSFEEKAIQSSFSVVKRVRVRGLQVKVLVNAANKGSENIKPDRSDSLEVIFKHSYKPTCRLYFSHRTEVDFNQPREIEDNHRWRRRLFSY